MGQCYDVVDSRPPNGLQIQLEGTSSDTLVMQNLGYFQLRSTGRCLEDKARGRDAFRGVVQNRRVQVEPVGFARSWYGPSFDADAEASDGVDIVVSDFGEASAHQLRVRKRKGQENVELLGEDDQSSWFFSSKKKKKRSKDTIHDVPR